MLAATLIALFVTMAMILVRAFGGPGTCDRVLAMNMLGTKTVLVIAVGGHLLEWTSYVDVALLYAMLNFVGTIAVLRFFESTTENTAG